MKKLVAILVVALVVVAGAGPWFMGRVAHARVDEGLDALVEKVPYIRVAERRWIAGWFRSESRVTFEFVLPGAGNRPVAALADAAPADEPAGESAPQAIPKFPVMPPLRFSVHSEVLHGPLLGAAGIGIARLDSRLVVNEAIRSKLIEVLGTDEPLRIRTRLAFLGGGTTTFSGDARTVPLSRFGIPQAHGSIAWDAFRLSIGISGKGRSYTVSGRQPRIEFRSEDGREHVLLTDLSVGGDSSQVTEDLYAGKVGVGVGKVSIASGRSPPVDVSAIRYDVESTSKGDYFDYALRMGSGEVKTPSLDALKFQLREVHYDMTLRHLHTPTLQKLVRSLRESYARLPGSPVGADMSLLAPFAEHGRELLKHDPQFVIDRIGIVTAQGEAAFRGVIRLTGVTDEDLGAGALALLPKIVADITFEAPQALFDSVPNGNMLVGMGVDQGYLKREGGKLTSHIEFRGGKLSVNGKSPRLPPMFGGQSPAG